MAADAKLTAEDVAWVRAYEKDVCATFAASFGGARERFKDGDRLLKRFSATIEEVLKQGRGHFRAVDEAHNELCVAAAILQNKNPEFQTLEYEAALQGCAKSIDFQAKAADGLTLFIDVKTIKPAPKDRWEQFEQACKEGWFPDNVKLLLSKEWLGGELWHNTFAARGRMLEYTLELEQKIAECNGPWKTSEYEFHLKDEEARRLIGKVLETFRDKHGSAPNEFFIHGRTTFNEEEWNAFKAVAPPETNVVAVRIKTTNGDVKLFRDGDYPVLRGTAVVLDERNAYLWTTGFVPRLDTYIGPETPNPLFVTVLRSTGELPDIRSVLTDIMGLTKINYNACNYSDGLPVTVRFANKVGEVLTMHSAKDAERQPLKFYV